MLERLGVKKHPRVKRGEVDAYVELPSDGLVLVFELTQDAKSSLLALNDVQFMAGLASQGCEPYSGKLSDGLVFADTRDQVRAKLGPPSEAIEDSRIDIWERAEHQLVVEYRKEFVGVKMVHLSAPDAD